MKTMKNITFGSILYVLMLVISVPSQAQNKAHYPIGQIVAVQGKAYSANDKSHKTIKAGDPVFLNNSIKTDDNSKVMILFIDDTQIALASNSELVIDEYIFDPYEAEENEGSFIITKGAFQWESGLLLKGKTPKVKITTSTGAIGVKGTKFWAGRIEGGYGIFVSEGVVEFSDSDGLNELSAGSGIHMHPASGFETRHDFWNAVRQMKAQRQVTFANDAVLQQRLKSMKLENIRKRHDYRGQMFSYKPNPYNPILKAQHDGFFTDEFEEMRQNR